MFEYEQLQPIRTDSRHLRCTESLVGEAVTGSPERKRDRSGDGESRIPPLVVNTGRGGAGCVSPMLKRYHRDRELPIRNK